MLSCPSRSGRFGRVERAKRLARVESRENACESANIRTTLKGQQSTGGTNMNREDRTMLQRVAAADTFLSRKHFLIDILGSVHSPTDYDDERARSSLRD